MRIIAGAWRGRVLMATSGRTTRPTADRVRQALFDMLWHAPWAGPEAVLGAQVLDVFAGTGALGLEALSRGAAQAWFVENDTAALAVLRANIGACRAAPRCTVLAQDATRPHATRPHATRPPRSTPCSLVFADPPYGRNLAAPALQALHQAGWIAPGALVVLEIGRDEAPPALRFGALVATRTHGAAQLLVWQTPHAVAVTQTPSSAG